MMKPPTYFYEIDLIRFLAALSVVGFHLGYLNAIADFRSIWPGTWFGWIGVEVFFVISGFVIANSANGKRPLQFLRSRVLRLYPAAWCCATLTLIVAGVISGGSFVELLPSYLRSVALVPKGPWIDDVYWTLAVEIGFYSLIFCLLCAGMFLRISSVAMALTIFSALCLTILAAVHWQVVEQSALTDLVDHSKVLLSRHGCFFALGAWLWISNTRSLKSWERIGVAVSIIACIGEILLRGLDFLPYQVGNISWLIAPVSVWVAAVGCVFVFSRPRETVIQDRMAKLLRTVGLMTYPLYLIHHVVGLAIMGHLVEIGIDKWLALASATVMTVVLSWIVCTFFEPRIRKVLAGIAINRPILQN